MQNQDSFLSKVISKLPVLIFDMLAIPIAWLLAYGLRYNLNPSIEHFKTPDFYFSLAILLSVQTFCYYHFKVYRGLWRFSSINDVIRILQSVVAGVVMVIPIFYITSLLSAVPRSVFPIYALVLSSILCAGRFIGRQRWDGRIPAQHSNASQRVLIIGAGQAGESLIRDLKRTPMYCPIGLIDDGADKKGLEIHGIRVLGALHDLERIVIRHAVDLIFITIPSATSVQMRHIVAQCERCNIPFRTLPSIHALASGRVEVNALREVRIEDLLGRDQVQPCWDQIATNIEGKRVLVTGGGGSIGSELCRQIMRLQPHTLMILDHSEYNLYAIEQELKRQFPETPIELALVNVTDRLAVNELMHRYKPQLVFHAAAYKHVPLLEGQIRVAIQNNIIGTQIVAEASVDVAADKFILISTDKAVNPTNVMGATKRVAEIFCQNINSWVGTEFITVRFGNVLDSVGSVVPLFKQQLKQGGPLTVTHPDIERYFMTIPEASQLILQAMASGCGGDILVLDMGEPVKIKYLAEQLIRLSGKEPDKDIHISYTGLRPGEKLYEELFHSSEQLMETGHEKLLKARFREIDWKQLTEAIALLESACATNHTDELFILLKNLVPEFKCDALRVNGITVAS
jgi:FlaA1/EpsC-like NDP-sugar epimerase